MINTDKTFKAEKATQKKNNKKTQLLYLKSFFNLHYVFRKKLLLLFFILVFLYKFFVYAYIQTIPYLHLPLLRSYAVTHS